MNRKVTASFVSGLLLVAGFLLNPLTVAYASADDDATCSQAKAAGNWSFTDSGTIIAPPLGQRVAVGRFTLTEDGNLVHGVAASSLNGVFADEEFYGTFSVRPDCTGTVQVKIFSDGIELFDVTLSTAYDIKMHQLRGIFKSVVTPSGVNLSTVIALEGRRE